MNSQTEDNGRPGPGDDALARLIRLAGRRSTPPRAAYEQVYAAASATWQGGIRRRRRRRLGYAIAASVAVAAVVVALLRGPGPGDRDGRAETAFSDVIAGSVQVGEGSGGDWRTLSGSGLTAVVGTRLRTGGDSGLGLTLADGGSFRLDEHTEVWFESPERVHLDRGAVYLDTATRGAGAAPMIIVTPLGSISHRGTRFEVRYTLSEMRLRVREGAVVIDPAGDGIQATAGQQVRVDTGGRLSRDRFSPYDAEWTWVQALAPLPPTEDLSLSRLLEWVSRETGREIHYSTPALRARAHTIVLHGSPGRLMPMEALAVMLQTTDFRYTVTGEGEILIEDGRR